MPKQKRPKRQRDLSVARIECPTCAGKGTVPNPDNIGDVLRRERLAAAVQGKAVALKMDISTGFFSDLEHGRRKFSAQQIDRYREALKEIAAEQSE